MNPLYLLSTLLFLCGVTCTGAERQYSTAMIPAELRKDANAVIRSSQMVMSIDEDGKAIITTNYVVTILNAKGQEYGLIREQFGKYDKVDYIEGTLYDSSGNELSSIKKKDIKDYSPPSYSDAEVRDVKFKAYYFDCKTYPYTCAVEVKREIGNTMNLDAWSPQMGYDCSVESASAEIRYPIGFPFRYKNFGVAVLHEKKEDGYQVLTASVTNLAAKEKYDLFAQPRRFHRPTVDFSMDRFALEGAQGSMRTWKDFGKFFDSLNAGRDVLSDESKAIVHRLADSCTSTASKIRVLYEHLQKTTRYVSIQLGIGGWQTLDANFVAAKGYGDCKALSNYMKAMLKEAQVTSYAVLISGDDDNQTQIADNFPANWFNHVILAVPTQKDTTWLECTSGTIPAGYLGSFTSDRKALMITEAGGIVVKTPAIDASVNNLTRKANFQIDETGKITGDISQRHNGSFGEIEYHYVIDQPKTEVQEHLNREFKISTYTVESYNISTNRQNGIPSVEETIHLSGTGNAIPSGENLTLQTGIFNIRLKLPSSEEKRVDSFSLLLSYSVKDTICYHLPNAYAARDFKDSKITLPFATYEYKVMFKSERELQVVSTCEIRKGTYAPALFGDYMNLCKQIKSDNSKRILLIKK